MDEIEFYDKVKEKADLKDREEAKKATEAVLGLLSLRLPASEAEDLKAQLPFELKAMITDKFERFGLKEFYERVQKQTGAQNIETAEKYVLSVFSVLKELVSKGEIQDVVAVTPLDMRALWEQA